MVEITALPAFDDNYIWLLRANGHVAVVDPGDATPVIAHLADSGDRLCAILATHHHGDHIGGVAELAARWPVPVFGPALENIAGVTRPLAGDERFELPEIGVALEVIAVPGHTRGHLAYYGPNIGAAGALFCGDTLFGAGCGRLFEGTPAQMQASLAALAVLPAPTLVYCAHEYTQSNLRFAAAVEPGSVAVQRRVESVARERAAGRATVPTRIGIELDTNPFLRWDAPAVRAAAAGRLGHAPADAIETFTAIREWKNRF
ncbi:MAG: hydroxyacylglutathione hydrolase [Sterolibacteriaceae bacterium]|jgi:hydroxyacylglutathione hydrolase|uniref:hydroxyacylglutathione hydrolase n=1 Tax=Sulfuritalea sp. TaxID=2480090 RepID=UPI001A5C0319|nr:hydroxyacylglutathione hydrolase [Sulfuritalea sp.]MBL8477785.1 hydroxyacylglutathione hydrolase [Sterolibacteriaceae bacterium]MBN8477259.1 hydroxyacylglutathione hydrolase [Sulfuritalea sp.]